ncbi:HNH endonuclease [Pseudokordiimonas caeni]|uniref:HNH endonuclease n=1 Tax=Pseudokordiimonas caeni TaxID=2997908 RepID=UPI0028112BF6|nr:HNH endonuclease [Pseudokordiimonas caeni]
MTLERHSKASDLPTQFGQMNGTRGLALSHAAPLQFGWQRDLETGRLFSVDDAHADASLTDAKVEAEDSDGANAAAHGGLDEPEDYPGRADLIVQAKFKDGQSGPKNVKAANDGKTYNLTFDRKDGGTIYFDKPKDNKGGWPSANHQHVNIQKGKKNGRDYGETLGGTKEYIDTDDRRQHFSMADKAAGIKPGDRTGKWTWHHLKTPTYDMALVDMAVHRAFGHNGGVHLWPKN